MIKPWNVIVRTGQDVGRGPRGVQQDEIEWASQVGPADAECAVGAPHSRLRPCGEPGSGPCVSVIPPSRGWKGGGTGLAYAADHLSFPIYPPPLPCRCRSNKGDGCPSENSPSWPFVRCGRDPFPGSRSQPKSAAPDLPDLVFGVQAPHHPCGRTRLIASQAVSTRKEVSWSFGGKADGFPARTSRPHLGMSLPGSSLSQSFSNFQLRRFGPLP